MFFWQSVHSNAKKSYQRYLWSTSWYLGIDRKSDFANLKGRDLWSLCCLLLPIASPNQTYRQKSSQEQVQRYTDVSIISTYAIYILYSERRVLQSKRDPTCFMFPFRSLALFAYNNPRCAVSHSSINLKQQTQADIPVFLKAYSSREKKHRSHLLVAVKHILLFNPVSHASCFLYPWNLRGLHIDYSNKCNSFFM